MRGRGSGSSVPRTASASGTWSAYSKPASLKATCDVPSSDLLGPAINGKTYNGFLNNDATFPAWYWYVQYMKPGAGAADQHGAHDAAVDRLWAKGTRASGSAQHAIFQQMVTQAIKDAWEIPLVYQPTLTFVSKKVGGVVGAKGSGTQGLE